MNNIVEVTIVIPVYNASTYLDRCLTSVLKQTYKNYEVILVDDGSNDGSETMCDKYEEMSDSFRAIHKVNGGPSSARNLGIKEAKGKYLLFLDSDDFLDEKCLEFLYGKMKKYDLDILISNYYTYPRKNISEHGYMVNKVMSGMDLINTNQTIHTKNDLCFSYRMFYKTEIAKKNNLLFNEKIKYGEDMAFNLLFLVKAQNALAIKEAFYYYNIENEGSLMSRPYKKEYETSILEQYKIRKNQYGFSKQYEKDMYYYYLEHIIYQMVENQKKSDDGLKKSDLKRINEYPMFVAGRKYFGIFYKTYSIKGYIVYLMLMFKFYGILYKVFDK